MLLLPGCTELKRSCFTFWDCTRVKKKEKKLMCCLKQVNSFRSSGTGKEKKTGGRREYNVKTRVSVEEREKTKCLAEEKGRVWTKKESEETEPFTVVVEGWMS